MKVARPNVGIGSTRDNLIHISDDDGRVVIIISFKEVMRCYQFIIHRLRSRSYGIIKHHENLVQKTLKYYEHKSQSSFFVGRNIIKEGGLFFFLEDAF